MARDNQRKRLYDAEADAGLHAVVSPIGRRLLVEEARLLPQQTHGAFEHNGKAVAPSIEDVQRYVDHLTSAAWFVRRFGRRRITVHHKVSGRATGGGGRISMPPWSRQEGVILHEVAHCLTRPGYASHGPEYAAVYLTLVRYRLGPGWAKALRETYRAHRVRTVAAPKPVFAVQPAARTRPVLAPSAREMKQAAEILRRAVKTGAFGPSGRKPRDHALATARVLEGGA